MFLSKMGMDLTLHVTCFMFYIFKDRDDKAAKQSNRSGSVSLPSRRSRVVNTNRSEFV